LDRVSPIGLFPPGRRLVAFVLGCLVLAGGARAADRMAFDLPAGAASGRSLSSSEASIGAILRVGLNEVVVRAVPSTARAPEHRLAVGGIGLGVAVAEQFLRLCRNQLT